MLRIIAVIMVLLIVLGSVGIAQEPPKLQTKFNGVFNAWGLMQRDFLLGSADYRDDYIVQMFRLNLAFLYGDNIKAVTRFDLGQGWWGVDNQGASYRGGSASALFDNKDTHFFLHVDQAYLWFNVPNLSAAFTIGRFQWAVGNRLVLDNNYDGVTADLKIGKSTLKLGWARVSEGVDGISDQKTTAKDWKGNYDARDANLLLATYGTDLGVTKLEFYGMYYDDASIGDSTAYLIDGLFYNRPRFTPQVTSLMVLGVSGTAKVDALTIAFEANYLTGKDEIKNPTHRGVLNTSAGTGVDALKYDINNGDASGYNAYVKASYAVAPAVTLGIVAGMGSGDDDPTSGKGNVNKLRTAGFFYLAEVWEDSIMPDEEGITPQGLGAPNIRAYRELENTTVLQFNGTSTLMPGWSLFASFTYLLATQDIYAWTIASGIDKSRKANDIGWEVDFKTDYKIYDNLTLTLRGGYFTPGNAAKYLITGTDTWDKKPWELKSEITFVF
ncbi:MAG: hypothetical protein WEE20_09005 [Bacteroidota bacterium]